METTIDLKGVFDRSAFDEKTLSTLKVMAFATRESLDRFRELTNDLSRAMGTEPERLDSGTALKLGLCEWLLGRPQQALAWFESAGESKDRHYYAGWCLRDLRRFDEAGEAFQKAASAGWNDAVCVCERAETMLVAGDLDGARSVVDGLPASAQKLAEAHYVLARLREKEGDVEGALASYEKSVKAEPQTPRTLFHLAFLSDLHGLDDRALELYRQCCTLPPVHINGLINLAVLLEDRGITDEAEQCLRRVLASHPNHARARLFLKDVLAAKDQIIDEEWERASELHNAIMDTAISEYELSVRSRNCLKKLDIYTLGDLMRISEADLLAYKNFGETSLTEIKAMLTQKGLKLGQAVEHSGTVRSAARRMMAVQGSPEILSKPVSELELSVRSRKCLQRLGIDSVADLASRTESELLSIRNFGQTSLSEIKRRLSELGISLRTVSA